MQQRIDTAIAALGRPQGSRLARSGEVAGSANRRSGVSLPLRWVAFALCLVGVAAAAGCTEERDGPGEGAAPPAECPGEWEGARCIKACGLAVETAAVSGISYEIIRSDAGASQRMQHPEASYTVATFLVSGMRVSFDIPRRLLSDLQAGDVELPLCVPLGMGSDEEGHAQYLPSNQIFSTDHDARGQLAITSYDGPSGIIEGIFRFDGALESFGGAGAEEPAERRVTHIEQGWFRAQPR